MQPVLVVLSDVAGLVYVNGRLAGEVEGERAVSLPVGAYGAVLLEHRPLTGGYLPLARRLVLSGGLPVAESLDGGEGLSVVAWPCGVVEAELRPERLPEPGLAAETLPGTICGARVRLLCGARESFVEFVREGRVARHRLPGGAPEIREWRGQALLQGRSEAGERYLRLLGPDLGAVELALDGREVEAMEEGMIRSLVDLNDTVGHARLDLWTPGEASPTATEMFWSEGTPRWPRTPQDTALAALEAAQLRLTDEANAYLTPALAQKSRPLWERAREYDSAARLKYPLSDGRQAVGLVRLAAPNCAFVEPLYYHALPAGGQQGLWRLDRLSF